MTATKNHVSGKCPICNERIHIARLECDNCGTGLEGYFKSFQ